MISGVVITPLMPHSDDRGRVMPMLRSDSPVFQSFGEIYFSTVLPGAIKAWRRHKLMGLNYALIAGEVTLVLFDDRPGSLTNGHVQSLKLTRDSYCLITIPPMVWNGFQGNGDSESIIANCATMPHDGAEIDRLPEFSSMIPHKWDSPGSESP